MNDRVATMIGFGLRSGTLAIGCDKILRLRDVRLVLAHESLSGNALDKLRRRCEANGIPLLQTDTDVLKRVGDGCKAIGFRDPNMAAEIAKHTDTGYRILFGGVTDLD